MTFTFWNVPMSKSVRILTWKSSRHNPEIDRPAGRSSCSAAGGCRLRGTNGGERSGWAFRRAGSSVPALSGRQPRVSRRTAGQNRPWLVVAGTMAERRGESEISVHHPRARDNGFGNRDGGPCSTPSDEASSTKARLPSSP